MGAKYGNPAWDETFPYWEAFWNNSCLDRPGIQIWYPEEHPGLYPQGHGPLPKDTPAKDLFTEPRAFLGRHFPPGQGCLGEAFSVMYPNWCGIEECLDVELQYTEGTIWVRPKAGELEDIDFSQFSLDKPPVRKLIEMLSYAAKNSGGHLFCGMPPMGNPGDTMARMRSYDGYCFDLVDKGDLAIQKENELAEIWRTLFNVVSPALEEGQSGSCGWLPTWSAGRSLLLEFDFCALISPEMFARFIPAMERRAELAKNVIYHFDGPGALPHLDTLLSLPWIDAIQAQPGAGIPDNLEWIPVYQRVQAAGKALYVGYNGVTEDEARVLLRTLKSEGLMLPVRFKDRDRAFKFAEEYHIIH
jgi:5-methyltetrahydrofolate--homocysteine methyltransferase